MFAPVGTRSLLGRERESAELVEALADAIQGQPHTVLVGGDAGIGKTTLVGDLQQRASELGWTVVVGQCLDIEAGISFAPVVEAVGVLLSGLEDLEARPSARRMRMLLHPEAPHAAEPFRAIEDLRQTFLEAAGVAPLLLVLEDMHWADRSTQDFATLLSRTARGRLVLVLTFRSDDLHRHHPLRRTLTEISRTASTRRLDVGPLDRDAIAGIVAARSGVTPDGSLVDAVLARSEGNPLYAEELVSAEQEALPGHLTDLLLARIDGLGAGPQALLRVASVNGSRLDTDTLPDLARLSRAEVDASLREALEANVLRQAGDSLEFRHGLLREAAYGDLLPDERVRLHRDLADLLEARVDSEPQPGLSSLSRLAFHCEVARDLPRTLAASVRAGVVAKRIGAAEAVTQLARAWSLWTRVPDAEVVAGLPRAELAVLLAEASHDQDDVDGWHELVREAVALVRPETDHVLASRVYSALGECFNFTEDTVGRGEAILLAVELAGDQATEQLARALVAQSSYHLAYEQFTECLDAATRAADAARTTETFDVLIEALRYRGSALKMLGRVDDAIEVRQEGIRVAQDSGLVGLELSGLATMAWDLVDVGQVERGMTLAGQGLEDALALGLPRRAAVCGEQLLTALVWQGRLSEAQRLLAKVGELGMSPYRLRVLRTTLLLAFGDPEGAAPLVVETAEDWDKVSGTPEDPDILGQIQLAAMRDVPHEAVSAATAYLTRLDRCDSPLRAASAARIGFHALSLAQSRTEILTEELADLAARQLDRARGGLTPEWRSTYYGVQLALAEAYRLRVLRGPATERFREAAALADRFGALFALEPRLELAEELLTWGGRNEGRELLVESWGAAREMGAHELERRAFRLGNRTRVPLEGSPRRDGPLSRLTPREREVLDLLVTGATNKTIAGALFISTKTVSTHVSHLLDKLSVENRGAAVALARRLQ